MTKSPTAFLGNLAASVLLGGWLALIGLNAAAGCGQGGSCIGLADFATPSAVQLATR
ncbi:MAG: hypothetical protein HQL39_15545 [Alphaproteobacteria bacterium]|nr:hypothetical protein [Alphaproteobacteria bacterium]